MSIKGLIELTHQPAEWIINHISSRRSHTCGGEREGAIPHKECWRSTLDLSRSPPPVKDLSDPVNLVQILLISMKLAENPLIYDFGSAPLFANLLIKIKNKWFFWGFLTWVMKNHSKLGNSGSIGLHGALSLKMSTYMTKTDYLAHFYYKINFSNWTIKK